MSKQKPTKIRKILLVDDAISVHSFFQTILKDKYELDFAQNGRLALEKINKNNYDLIISDILMPEMDGFELVRTLKKADSEYRSIPIILLTSYEDSASLVEGFEIGADEYLTKYHLNEIELTARINSILKLNEYQQIIANRNRQLERELGIARRIMKNLLPTFVPIIAGYDLHTAYIPMDQVGGDFYNFWEQENALGILIADVSGHGIPGAFLASIARIAFDYTVQSSADPAVILRKMNYEIYEKTISGMFITAFFCILDNAHRILHYSCAGHNRPILYRASNNSIIELDAEGLPLGLDAENPLVPQQIQLKKGDRILFYTDALIESSNEKNGMFGLARLYKYMEQTHKIKAELFTQNLINIIKNHSSHYQQTGNFEDDLTLIVLDVK